MSTSYDLIYDRFLSKITDYELSSLANTDLENSLLRFLRNAIPKFKYCTKDLSDRDDTNQVFNVDLTEREQEILALLMLVEWINPNILRLENIRQNIGSKDFQIYSGANHLEKLSALKSQLQKDAETEMTYYYYSTSTD
jgi:hypothetical protein